MLPIPLKSYQLNYDLSLHSTLLYYIPTIYISEGNQKKDYLDKKASKDVLTSFGIETNNLDEKTKKMFALANDLKPESIFKKFEKNEKSKKKIADLFLDIKISYLIKIYIDLKINQFLEIIDQNNFLLSINLSKEKDFFKSKVTTQNAILNTNLHFDKTKDGINYILKLTNEKESFYPFDKKITLLTNQPSWIIVNNNLHQIAEINSNKIKPFLTKKIVTIPQTSIQQYFETFIKDIVKKVAISANGFEVITKNDLLKPEIIIVENFIKKQFQIDLNLNYGGYSFLNSAKKNVHSNIDFTDIDNIKVVQYKRNQIAENQFEQKLIGFGFQKLDNNLYSLIDESMDNEEFKNIDFVLNNQYLFLENGFWIENLSLNQKKINTNLATISTKTTTKTDWFDVLITIECGEYRFSFNKIINHIKNQNRYYELPDGTYFLIPSTWMTKYNSLINFAKQDNETLILPKNNLAIIEKLEVLSEKKINNLIYSESKNFKASLRNYQIDGVNWILSHYNNGLGCCLADDMGLGKTIQTLAVLNTVSEQISSKNNIKTNDLFSDIEIKNDPLRALIIMPSSLVFNWYNESKKFTPQLTKIQYIGGDRKQLSKKLHLYDLIFTTYNIVTRDAEIFEKYNFRYIILDESQQIKNRDSKVFKAINSIKTENKISLSGTPIENSLNDLWAQMQFINPNILGSFPFFTKHFKLPIEKKQSLTATNELKTIIKPFILRRTKQEVLTDLPDYTEQIIYCEMDLEQQKWYEQEKSKARNEILKITDLQKNTFHALQILMKLRQLANHPKMLEPTSEVASGKFFEVTTYIETIVKSEQKILIFSSFTTQLDIYKNWCKDQKIEFSTITGDVKIKDRETQVTQFQTDANKKIFFISLKSGSTGLNLTQASYVLILDPWWNPFAESQAISRAHRIGQVNKVHVARFVSQNTIEQKIIELQNRKKLLSDNIIDLEFVPKDFAQNITELLI